MTGRSRVGVQAQAQAHTLQLVQPAAVMSHHSSCRQVEMICTRICGVAL